MTIQTDYIDRKGLKQLKEEITKSGGKILKIENIEMGWIKVISEVSK